MDISIIVPVFNVEKYLVRCLDSILYQQFSGTYEVIAVDDGSTDNSLQILLDYQKNNSRLRVIAHGTNKKLSIARSSGIKVSTGNYIMHIDSDDWLLPGALEKLFNKCKETNADVVVFNYIIKENNRDLLPEDSINKELLTSNKLEIQKHFFGASINKIIKRELTEDIIYGTIEVNSTEDLLYSYEMLLKANTFYLFPELFYIYSRNIESLTNTVHPVEFIRDQVIVLNQVQLIVEKYKPSSDLTENLLDYLDKWLYLRIAQMHFWYKLNREMKFEITSQYRNLAIMSQTRVNKLESTITYKFASLKEIIKRFGFRTTLGLLYRIFSK